jgi:hypothetical protein
MLMGLAEARLTPCLIVRPQLALSDAKKHRLCDVVQQSVRTPLSVLIDPTGSRKVRLAQHEIRPEVTRGPRFTNNKPVFRKAHG